MDLLWTCTDAEWTTLEYFNIPFFILGIRSGTSSTCEKIGQKARIREDGLGVELGVQASHGNGNRL